MAYAVPNYIARASAFAPNDPGYRQQWNFFGPFGVNMPEAWELAAARGAPGGRGAVVAVLDTGVAYRSYGRYRRAPDLRRFARGYDFVGDDRFPNDQNGHGTHVAGTIAQSTNNGIGAAGIAYRARIMPVRVLDSEGAGDTFSISRGIRFAARRGVDVINLSLEFDSSVRASQIPDIVSALRYARRKGVASWSPRPATRATASVAYPRAPPTWSPWRPPPSAAARRSTPTAARRWTWRRPAAASTPPTPTTPTTPRCAGPTPPGRSSSSRPSRRSVRRFGLPRGYEGTSMAAPTCRARPRW